MSYIFAKLFQAAGLVIILVAFLYRFPQLMSPKILLFGIVVFTCGWVIDRYLVR